MILALILGLVDYGFASRHETALLHHAPAGRVVDEMPADEGFDARSHAYVPYHQFKGFRANAFVPIRFGNPISNDGFAMSIIRNYTFSQAVILFKA